MGCLRRPSVPGQLLLTLLIVASKLIAAFLADLHISRAELAKLAGDDKEMRVQCDKAIAICEATDCGYAWAKQDPEALLGQ